MQRKCNYFALWELTDESLYGFSVGLSSRAVVAPVLIPQNPVGTSRLEKV
jgi:hypothetical protein